MTKAAVAMLTKTLAIEAGPHGIRVNALAPGVILTNFSSHYFVNEDGTVDDDKLAAYKKNFGAMAPRRARRRRRGRRLDDPLPRLRPRLVRDRPDPPPQRRRRDALVAPLIWRRQPGEARRKTGTAFRCMRRGRGAALAPQAPCTPPPGWADADAR